jgi:uncharacterized membrane protein YkvA (DUF1232 family)
MSPREDDDRPPAGFARFRRRAANLVQDREALRRLAGQGFERVEVHSGALDSVLDDLRTLIRLLDAWVRADYRQVSRSTLTLVAAAVLYFVVPTDLIPDFLFGFGFVDDIAVVGWVARHIRGELEVFRRWEQRTDAMDTMVGRSMVPDQDPDAGEEGR